MGTRISTFTVDAGVQRVFVMDCSECGVIYGFSAEYEARRRDDGKGWKCPNGHGQVFTKSETDKQRERADQAERELAWARSREAAQRREKEHAQRSAAAYRGQVTRMRNKIAAGVCPVGTCRRPFVNVKAHIESQHPAWAHDHPEVLA